MVYGFSPYGAMGSLVRVEVDLRRGIPSTEIVGLAGHEVREARDRVRAAIRNSGFEYPLERILVNLSPAEIPKQGAGFDLPVALAILRASGQVSEGDDVLAYGELSVNGLVHPARGALSAAIAAGERSIDTCLLPVRQLASLSGLLTDLPPVFAIDRLRDLRARIERCTTRPSRPVAIAGSSFDDMHGQALIKWSSAICAAGFHNLLFMGPPGSGKTMAAERIVSLTDDLGRLERLESARIYSLRGESRSDAVERPPLRMPHHSATLEGMIGGGRSVVPGEASLAHHGVLLLDEATEFRPRVLQALREPIESGRIVIHRAGRIERYPARFRLILTSNLCPCGKLGQPEQTCLCSIHEIERYWRRLGAALLDRVEIRVRTWYRRDEERSLSHAELRDMVGAATGRQRARWGEGVRNGTLLGVRSRIPLPSAIDRVFHELIEKRGLSDRAADGVRSVARTIADLDDREDMREEDIREAISLHGEIDVLAPVPVPGLA